jgi:hypothetical protein
MSPSPSPSPVQIINKKLSLNSRNSKKLPKKLILNRVLGFLNAVVYDCRCVLVRDRVTRCCMGVGEVYAPRFVPVIGCVVCVSAGFCGCVFLVRDRGTRCCLGVGEVHAPVWYLFYIGIALLLVSYWLSGGFVVG